MSDQPSMFAPSGPSRIPLAEAEPLVVWPRWIRNHALTLDLLAETLPFEQHTLQTPGGRIPAPRLECWLGPRAGMPYVYSGERYLSHRLADYPVLDVLRGTVEHATGIRFDSAFVNLYRTGKDSIGWHADAEVAALGPLPEIVIASVSLGARRSFQVKHRETDERVAVELGEGDLLLMGRGVQSRYLHAAPKTARDVDARMNITFRRLECR